MTAIITSRTRAVGNRAPPWPWRFQRPQWMPMPTAAWSGVGAPKGDNMMSLIPSVPDADDAATLATGVITSPLVDLHVTTPENTNTSTSRWNTGSNVRIFSAGEDFSFVWRGRINNVISNGGWWRSVANTDWCIASSGVTPWMRIAGDNVLLTGSNIPRDRYISMVWRAKSGTSQPAEVWIDGKSWASTTHSKTTVNTDVINIGYQAGETVLGNHADYWFFNQYIPDAAIQAFHDPASRWSMYDTHGRTLYFLPATAAAAGGRIMSSLVGSGGLAGRGGIAGAGGGLAA